jgi:hypothetical protein
MKTLLGVIFFLSFTNLVYAEFAIDENNYLVEEFNLYAPPPTAEAEDEFYEGFLDGFQRNHEEDELLEGMRFDDYRLQNAFDENLPEVKAEVFGLKISSKKCESTTYISLNYPTNTGSDASDNYIQSFFESLLDSTIQQAVETMDEDVESDGECPKWIPKYVFQSSFAVFSPKPGLISIHIIGNHSFGGNHPMNYHRSLNVRTKDGHELTFADVFPKPQESIKKLWPYLANRYCSEEEFPGRGDTLPHFFGGDECRPGGYDDSSPLPDNLNNETLELSDLAEAVFFTSEGMLLFLDAYSGWAYVWGPATIFIPKKEAMEMGVSPSIWE